MHVVLSLVHLAIQTFFSLLPDNWNKGLIYRSNILKRYFGKGLDSSLIFSQAFINRNVVQRPYFLFLHSQQTFRSFLFLSCWLGMRELFWKGADGFLIDKTSSEGKGAELFWRLGGFWVWNTAWQRQHRSQPKMHTLIVFRRKHKVCWFVLSRESVLPKCSRGVGAEASNPSDQSRETLTRNYIPKLIITDLMHVGVYTTSTKKNTLRNKSVNPNSLHVLQNNNSINTQRHLTEFNDVLTLLSSTWL